MSSIRPLYWFGGQHSRRTQQFCRRESAVVGEVLEDRTLLAEISLSSLVAIKFVDTGTQDGITTGGRSDDDLAIYLNHQLFNIFGATGEMVVQGFREDFPQSGVSTSQITINENSIPGSLHTLTTEAAQELPSPIQDGDLLHLTATGEIGVLRPPTSSTGWGGAQLVDLTGGLPLGTIDVTDVFDVGTGTDNVNFSGILVPESSAVTTYKDIATHVGDGFTDILVTGLTLDVSFVLRLRYEGGTLEQAKVIVSSTALPENPQGEIPAISPGIAVNDQGTVLTVLPTLEGTFQRVYEPVAFHAEFDDGTGAPPQEAFDVPIWSQGITTNSFGDFVLTDMPSFTGRSQSFLFVISRDLSNLFFQPFSNPFFSTLGTQFDATVSSDDDQVFVTTNLFGDSPIIPNPTRRSLSLFFPAIPDFEPSPLVVSTVPGTTTDASTITTADTVFVDAAILNDGTGAAGEFTVEMFLDGTNLVFSDTVSSLLIQDTIEFLDINLGMLSPGEHELTFKVDTTGAFGESGAWGELDESNNVVTKTFTVVDDSPAIGTADVFPFAFSGRDHPIVIRTASQPAGMTATHITTADDVLVDLGFLNGGLVSTGSAYRIEIQLDGNPPQSADIGPHNPFFGSTFTGINFGTLSAGVHTFTSRADVMDAVDESVEANNIVTRTFVVSEVGTEDFGDAPTAAQSGFPSSYPTLLADGGARHIVLAGFHLGAAIDAEADGLASSMAFGDDDIRSGSVDEDGVILNGALIHDTTHTFDVEVTNTAGVSNPYLDVWIDYNQDGDWSDPGEHVYSALVAAGANAIQFAVPIGIPTGQTYARFRLHNGTTPLTPGGPAADGEVEDYLVQIQAPGEWVFQGPAPVDNGQIENVSPQNRVTGAVHTVLAHPTDSNTLYIGSVNGGIWKTTNATATNPDWTPQTDFLGSLSIAAMAFDPADATHNTLVAGTGRFSSFGTVGGQSGLVYRTTDGGVSWTNPGSAGLVGENVSGIVANGNTIVVSSSTGSGGLFRSTDGGATFSPIASADFAAGDDFWDLVADPTNLDRLYAASVGGSNGTGAIYRSDDFGATWTRISGPAINAAMDELLVISNAIEMTIHPTTGRLYVAVLVSAQPQGIFYTNSGASANPTWTQMDVPILPLGTGTPLSDATNASPIVITSNNHGLRTGDFVVIEGVTGNTAANGFFRVTVPTNAMGNPVNPNEFRLDLSSGNGNYTGGGSWTKVTGPNPTPKALDPGSQGRLHFSIVVDPSNEDILYIGGDRQDRPGVIGATTGSGALFRGNASLASDSSVAPSPQWDHLTHYVSNFDADGGTASGSSPHADSREMVFDAAGNLIQVDDGGVYKRTSPQDNTGDWFSLAGNLGTVEFHSVMYDSLTNTIVGGTQDNGTQNQRVPGGTVWDLFFLGDGGDVAIDNIVNAGSNQSVRYTSSQRLGGFRRTIFDANGNVVSFTSPQLAISGGGDPIVTQFYTPVRANNAAGNRLLIVGDNSIYESLDGGATLTEVGPGFGPNVAPLSAGQNAADYGTPGNVNAAYVGTRDDIAVRTTAGSTFSLVDPDSGSLDFIESVIMNPADYMNAFVIDSNQVFQTTDAGSSWMDVTGNLMSLAGSFLQSITYVPGVTDTVVVGGALGVFAAQVTNLMNWVEVGTTLPNAIAYDLDYDAADDVLLVGTLGRGAWLMHAASTALENLFFSTPAPELISTSINDGSPNRSGIDRITFTFSEAVTISSATAFILRNHTTGSTASLDGAMLVGNGTSVVTLDLSDSDTDLDNGHYTLELPASAAVNASNFPLDRTQTVPFHKQAGDIDGDGVVNFNDTVPISLNFAADVGPYGPGDGDGDGIVNFNDTVPLSLNFGASLAPLTYDFGDAPEFETSYPTTLANDGARHIITGNTLLLGAERDGEPDGQPIAGDGADEDGLLFDPMIVGTSVDVTLTSSGAGFVNGWVDFNTDGDWDDPGEQVFDDVPVALGPNILQIAVPAGAALGDTFARFRLTGTAGYSYFGLAPDGEVEDYPLTILEPQLDTSIDVAEENLSTSEDPAPPGPEPVPLASEPDPAPAPAETDSDVLADRLITIPVPAFATFDHPLSLFSTGRKPRKMRR